MTESAYVKSQGLPSLAFISRETKTSRETLRNWYYNKRDLFDVVIDGCKSRLNK